MYRDKPWGKIETKLRPHLRLFPEVYLYAFFSVLNTYMYNFIVNVQFLALKILKIC